MSERTELPASLSHLRWLALLVGVAGLVCTALLAPLRLDLALKGYLIAFLVLLGVTLGSMGWVMIHHLTGGEWGFPVRRLAEVAASLTPLMLVLFVPIGVSVAAGSSALFPWVGASGEAAHEIQTEYLGRGFFLLRAAVYFAVWIVVSLLLVTWGRKLEETRDGRLAGRLRGLSAVGLLLYFYLMSFATVDWVMSRQVGWWSTIIGMITVVGQALTAMAFLIVMLAALAKREPFHGALSRHHFHDLGNLMLTGVVLWSYMSFAQYLIIWCGNLSEEIPWYLSRRLGIWTAVAAALIVLHFFVPFFILLSRWAKRNVRVLTAVAVLVLVMRGVDVLWWVAPSGAMHAPASHRRPEGPEANHAAAVEYASAAAVLPAADERPLAAPEQPEAGRWTDYVEPLADVAALAGVGGVWLAAYLWLLPRRAMLMARVGDDEPHETTEASHA